MYSVLLSICYYHSIKIKLEKLIIFLSKDHVEMKKMLISYIANKSANTLLGYPGPEEGVLCLI